MKLVYFGKKRPKAIKTVSPELLESAKEEDRRAGQGITYMPFSKTLEYNFVPFKAIEVEDEVALVLLEKAGDLFKCVDEGDSAPDPKPKVKTDGYVGDTHAENIKDLNKTKAREMKAEKGKSVDEIIDTERSKKKSKGGK